MAMVAGMAISLADPGGPIEATKETVATLRSATNPPSREQREAGGAVGAKLHHPQLGGDVAQAERCPRRGIVGGEGQGIPAAGRALGHGPDRQAGPIASSPMGSERAARYAGDEPVFRPLFGGGSYRRGRTRAGRRAGRGAAAGDEQRGKDRKNQHSGETTRRAADKGLFGDFEGVRAGHESDRTGSSQTVQPGFRFDAAVRAVSSKAR